MWHKFMLCLLQAAGDEIQIPLEDHRIDDFNIKLIYWWLLLTKWKNRSIFFVWYSSKCPMRFHLGILSNHWNSFFDDGHQLLPAIEVNHSWRCIWRTSGTFAPKGLRQQSKKSVKEWDVLRILIFTLHRQIK